MGLDHYDARGDTEWACGGDADCSAVEAEPDCVRGYEHRWTRKGMGGCDSNPGVWSLGGTTYRHKARCILCGCERTETNYGWQRSPGECDRLEYEGGASQWSPAEMVDTDEAREEKRRQDRNERRRERRRAQKKAAAIAIGAALRALAGPTLDGALTKLTD